MLITFYAGAADAAGTTTTEVEGGLTAAELISRLSHDNEHLGQVLAQCSLLVDGRPVQGGGDPIPDAARVDVLPPFAGG